MRSGVILAGGRSTRFGEDDKAVAPLAGTPMIRRVADRLEPVVDELVVNCREDQRTAIGDAMEGYPLELCYAIDDEPDMGPMVGIRNGLEATTGEYGAVVACDMPFVEPELVEYLFDRAAGHDGAVPRLEDGWYQTTQAVYRADRMVEACDRAIDRGDRRVIAPLEELEYVVVEDEHVFERAGEDTFRNVNTREELDRAERLFSGE